MIEFLINFINFIAGIIVTGLGVTVTLAGFKIILTGLGWVF